MALTIKVALALIWFITTVCGFSNLDVMFYFYRSGALTETMLTGGRYNRDALNRIHYNASQWTRIISHGWNGNVHTEYMYKLMNAYVQKTQDNVILVDWSAGSQVSYPQAIIHAKIVGNAIGQLIQWLEIEVGASRKRMHVMGYSLGGQVAGHSGAYFTRINQAKIGRVTGLDTSSVGIDETPDDCIDPTDADFVDEIHTQLSRTPKGHADFYVNGGVEQPGCTDLLQKMWNFLLWIFSDNHTLGRAVGCDHERAVWFFVESVTSQTCFFAAPECASYDDMINGRCDNNEINFLGHRAYKPISGRKIYHLRTNEKPPFCIK